MKLHDRILSWLLRMGAPLGPMALLTAAGRISGKPRSTPIAILPDEGGWRLTAAYGVGDWVKNLRAAGEATVTTRGRRVHVVAREVPPSEAAPHLRQIMADAGPTTRKVLASRYGTPVDAPIEEWEAEAARHPMFLLQPSQTPPTPQDRMLRLLVGLLVLGLVTQVFLAGLAAFDDPRRWAWHRSFGTVVEAIALIAAIVAIARRRVGARWLTAGIFILITFQHGTAAIGSGLAAGLHSVSALVMLTMAFVIRRRLRATKTASTHRPGPFPMGAISTPAQAEVHPILE